MIAWHGAFWRDQSGVDLHRKRALEQTNRHDKFVISLELGQHAHNAAERPRFNSDFLSYVDKWPWLGGSARPDQCPDRADLLLVHRSRNVIKTYNLQEPWRL